MNGSEARAARLADDLASAGAAISASNWVSRNALLSPRRAGEECGREEEEAYAVASGAAAQQSAHGAGRPQGPPGQKDRQRARRSCIGQQNPQQP